MLNVGNYFYLKELFISKYGDTVKNIDDHNVSTDSEDKYSVWQNKDYKIKLLFSYKDGKNTITIGYLSKNKTDS